MPDVSVIVPAFNAEKTIERCLDSLLAQAADIEVIVVDDCSTDATLAMCKRYARNTPHNVRVIHNEKNVGQGLSRNVGIGVATGDYLAFVDADDYVAPFMYEDLLALARPAGGEQVDIVGCDVCSPAPSVPGGFGRIQRLASVQTYDAEAIRREVLPEHLGAPPDKAPWPRAFPGSACAYLFSARLVREGEVRFLSERQVYSEDLFFDYAALSRARSFAFTTTAYYFYVNRPGSTVHRYHDPRSKCELLAELAGDDPELLLRARHSIIYCARTAGKQLCEDPSFSWPEKARTLAAVCAQPVLTESLADYPMRTLSLPTRVYLALARRGLAPLALVLPWVKLRLSSGKRALLAVARLPRAILDRGRP